MGPIGVTGVTKQDSVKTNGHVEAGAVVYRQNAQSYPVFSYGQSQQMVQQQNYNLVNTQFSKGADLAATTYHSAYSTKSPNQ